MEQQTSLFDKKDSRSGSAQEMIGCCSRFRECSDAGECLIKDEEHCKKLPFLREENWPRMIELSANCAYRKNLESGKIFYGKNQNGFSMDRYKEFRRKIDMLTPGARTAFDNILVDLCEYNRGAIRCMVRNMYLEELEEIGLFDFRKLGAEFPMAKVGKWDYRRVLQLVYEHSEYVPLFKQAQEQRKRERKPLLDKLKAAKEQKKTEEIKSLEAAKKAMDVTHPGEDTKEFLRSWLNHEAIPLRDTLAEPYRFACKKPDLSCYAEEIYRDLLVSGFDSRIYIRSPFAEDGLLSPFSYEDEEIRRLKLSKGYPQEEKSHRLAEIQQARSARTARRRNIESDS